jgi:hypothetical protein
MKAHLEDKNLLNDGTANHLYPFVFKNDILHYREILQAYDRHKLVTTMKLKWLACETSFK